MKNAFPIVLSAPSGAGKTSLSKKLVNLNENFLLSISYTTRKCRGKELNDVDYHFISEDLFNSMIIDDFFLEWAYVHKNKYGTSCSSVMNAMDIGKCVIFDVDVEGGLQIKKKYSNALLIFILPPSISELKNRLIRRGTDLRNHIASRIEASKKEINIGLSKYDYVIVNKKFDEALADISSIIRVKFLNMINRGKIINKFL